MQCSKAVTDQWEADPEGKPKTKEEELAKSGTKFTAKLAKAVAKSGIVKGPAAKAVEGAANLAENQAEMGPNATLGDRLRHGGMTVLCWYISSFLLHNCIGICMHGTLKCTSSHIHYSHKDLAIKI